MHRHHLARAVREKEKVAAAQPPKIARSILNSRGMLRGHERPEIRQVGKQHGGLRQPPLTLQFKLLKGIHRIVQGFVDFTPRMISGIDLNDEEDGAGQHGCGQDEGEKRLDEGEKKLGSQPDVYHGPFLSQRHAALARERANTMICRTGTCSLTALLLSAIAVNSATAAQVTGQVTVAAATGSTHHKRDAIVVLWLTSLADHPAPRVPAQNPLPHPTLIQKNKTFEPHVLAVQVGSEVDFPNRDPFFHNVFSLFNGKRFDLGLYEAGASRGVRFDRAGICYIFCNIHPQMSAVVVVVDTPYFTVSDAQGNFTVPDIPPGRFRLNLWEGHCSTHALEEISRQVGVGENGLSLGTIHLQESDLPAIAHLNKYGKQYDPQVTSTSIYVQP